MEELRKRRAQYMVVLCVSIGTMTLGAVASWPSPAFIKFRKNETGFVVTQEDMSWIVSVNNFGFIAGSLATRYTSDRLGRWATIISSSLPYIIGTAIVAFGSEAWPLYAARIFWGFGTGMMATVVGMYVAEIADKEIRGRLSVCTKFMTNLGNLLTMSIGPVVSYRVMNFMLLLLPVCHFLACLWIPESPYYYLKQGKVDLAERELIKLRGYKNKEEFNEELDSMKMAVTSEMRRKSSTKELVTGRRYRKAIIIAIGLKFTQIMTGAVIIKQYLGIIMQEARVKMAVEHALLIYGLTEFGVSIISSVLADRVGRRPLLFWSYLGTALSLGSVAIYFFFQEVIKLNEESLRSFGFVTLLGVILANIISTIGFNSVIYVIISEIFPINVRSVAMTCLSILGGIFGFAVSKGFKNVTDICGLFGAFTIFTLVAVFGVFFVLMYVPETRGKSLTEIQVELQGDLYDSRGENDSTAKSNEDSHVLLNIETKATKS